MFLDRLFYRIKHKKVETISALDFKEFIEKSGFQYTPDEFENLVKWHFKNKDEITQEEFKAFATG